MQKLSFLFITIATAILAYLGLGTLTSVSTDDPAQTGTGRPAYDGYSEGINTVMYNEEGDIAYTLQAERQYHFPDQTSDLDQPFIRLFQDGMAHWNIVAESGKIAPAQNPQEERIGLIELSGDVEVYRLDDFGNRTILETDFLEIDPGLETMQTDRLVSMTTTNIQQRAEGLFANLAEDRLLFRRNSEGKYEEVTEL